MDDKRSRKKSASQGTAPPAGSSRFQVEIPAGYRWVKRGSVRSLEKVSVDGEGGERHEDPLRRRGSRHRTRALDRRPNEADTEQITKALANTTLGSGLESRQRGNLTLANLRNTDNKAEYPTVAGNFENGRRKEIPRVDCMERFGNDEDDDEFFEGQASLEVGDLVEERVPVGVIRPISPASALWQASNPIRIVLRNPRDGRRSSSTSPTPQQDSIHPTHHNSRRCASPDMYDHDQGSTRRRHDRPSGRPPTSDGAQSKGVFRGNNSSRRDYSPTKGTEDAREGSHVLTRRRTYDDQEAERSSRHPAPRRSRDSRSRAYSPKQRGESRTTGTRRTDRGSRSQERTYVKSSRREGPRRHGSKKPSRRDTGTYSRGPAEFGPIDSTSGQLTGMSGIALTATDFYSDARTGERWEWPVDSSKWLRHP
jgi:hypothetical protein